MDAQLYIKARERAIILMEQNDELEPTSALKQAASDYGIPYGTEMGDFIRWARDTFV